MGANDVDTEPTDPSRRLQLQVTPDFANLGRVRRFIIDVLLDGTDDRDTLYLVAANELVTNAIETHHRVGTEEPITVSVDPDRRTVIVADLGEGYRPGERETPTRFGESGRGLWIAESISPGLSWKPNHPQGTVFDLPCPRTAA